MSVSGKIAKTLFSEILRVHSTIGYALMASGDGIYWRNIPFEVKISQKFMKFANIPNYEKRMNVNVSCHCFFIFSLLYYINRHFSNVEPKRRLLIYRRYELAMSEWANVIIHKSVTWITLDVFRYRKTSLTRHLWHIYFVLLYLFTRTFLNPLKLVKTSWKHRK